MKPSVIKETGGAKSRRCRRLVHRDIRRLATTHSQASEISFTESSREVAIEPDQRLVAEHEARTRTAMAVTAKTRHVAVVALTGEVRRWGGKGGI